MLLTLPLNAPTPAWQSKAELEKACHKSWQSAARSDNFTFIFIAFSPAGISWLLSPGHFPAFS